MKILVIYSNDSKKEVVELREELAGKYGSSSVLRLHSSQRKKLFSDTPGIKMLIK